MGNALACCCRRRENADCAGYYAALGVRPTATSAEIEAAMEHIEASPLEHTADDVATRFRAVRAYAVLSNPYKRVLYDKFGEEGVAAIDYAAPVATISSATPGVYQFEPNDGFLVVDASHGLWNEPPLLEKRIASDRLALVQQISSGEYGDLWLGQLGETKVAIKQLKSTDQTQANALPFATEIVRMTQLSHPKIVAFVGVEWTKQWETRAVAEFLPRGDLRSLLSSSEAAALDWATFKCKVVMDVVDALVYLQSQPHALMATLTSRNVLLDGDDGSCKLSLFAAARSRQSEIDSGQYLPWVAPEIVLGVCDGAALAAIYSLGVLLCELDTAKPPFFDALNPNGSPMSNHKIAQLVALGKLQPSLSDECPDSIASLARDCLAFDPTARPTTTSIAYRLRDVLKNDL